MTAGVAWESSGSTTDRGASQRTMAPPPAGRAPRIDKAVAKKLQMKLQAATKGITIGTGTKLEELLKLHDRSGDGLLDAAELTSMIRRAFNVQKHEVHLRAFGGGGLAAFRLSFSRFSLPAARSRMSRNPHTCGSRS